MAKVNGRKLNKTEVKVKYIWEQTEKWLKHRFNLNTHINNVIEQTGVARKYNKYAFIVPTKEPDPNRRGLQRTVFNLVIDKRYMLDANKEQQLEIAGRAALEVMFMLNNKKFSDRDIETQKALYQYGLPRYGNFPHQGLTLHQYSCSECDQIITLRERKIPKSKDIAYNPNMLSSCCDAIIKYDGRVEYTNEECQKLARFIKQ